MYLCVLACQDKQRQKGNNCSSAVVCRSGVAHFWHLLRSDSARVDYLVFVPWFFFFLYLILSTTKADGIVIIFKYLQALEKRKVWLDGGARWKASGSSKLLWFILKRPWIYWPNLMSVHSIGWRDIAHKSIKVILMVAPDEKSKKPKSVGLILWGTKCYRNLYNRKLIAKFVYNNFRVENPSIFFHGVPKCIYI